MREYRDLWRVKVRAYKPGSWAWHCEGHWQNGYPVADQQTALRQGCDHVRNWHWLVGGATR